MPIYTPDNTFMHRILNGDIEVKRVYEGDTLAWGLYEIIYHNKDEDTSDYKPNRYVWGLKYDLYQLETDEFDEYLMHCDGWYEDKLFVTAIPYITKDFHKDLELFAKWRRRKYSYGGTITWYKWDSGGGGGSFTVRSSINSPTFMGYDLSYYWDPAYNIYAYPTICLPNCTTYAYGRCIEVGIGAPTISGRHNASNWPSYTNYDVISYSASALEPGDLIVWARTSGGDTSGHVAFYEGGGLVSASGFSSNYRYSTMQDTSNYWYSGSGASDSHAFNYKTVDGESTWGGNNEDPSAIIKTSEGLGGSGTWDDEPYTVPKTECTDQEYPSFPNADDLKKGDTNPQGEYKPSVWSTRSGDSTWQVYYTDTSYYNYDTSQWSEWTNEATQNSKTDPSAHFLMDWD